MDHWRRTAEQRRDGWSFLEGDARADVMLLQESVVPSGLPRSRFVHRQLAGSRPWGSAVVGLTEGLEVIEIDAVRTRYGATHFSMLGSHPGAVIVAKVDLPSIGPVACVSVYSVMNVYAQTTMLRVVADLIPLFDSRYGDRVVLGGDFNISTSIKPDTPELPRYKAILRAVESLGLKNLAGLDVERPPSIPNCPCGERTCRHLHTYGLNPGGQLDWLYATPDLARMCRRVRLERSVVGRMSDHAPIIADFRMSPRDSDSVCDPESFVETLAHREGAESAQIAEALIAWALRKHQGLEVGGVRTASLDRLPTASGLNPQLWVQLDIRRPEGLQYTFSLTGDGKVVVQFQYMTAPFDTLEGRERIWSRICEIEGVSLERRLNGRPSFSITALANWEKRERFERIFADVVDETLRVRSV